MKTRFKNSALQGAFDEVNRVWGKQFSLLGRRQQERELQGALLTVFGVVAGSSLTTDAAFRKHFADAVAELQSFLNAEEK